ncbi:HNH nuclease [Klenkia terrae]|uniref:HNH endonuclease signature motif containing protein n=1 Tax=Klenkia terrae TaxID=1052259 RepID=UPI00175B8216|nr:HNH endonuclease signature motif containing protein [Klenkia terrae]SSC24907.1 HNH nuclease [Klenkia terrae]
MTATARRFRVEVTPYVTAVPVDAAPVPRLTELAAAAGLSGTELDAELASVQKQMSALAAYRAGLIERKATLGARQPLPFAPGARTDTRPDADPDLDPSVQAADDFLPDEVAVLLNMSVGSARYLVDDDLTLVRQFPAVWEALADQRIDETRAKAIVRALRYQARSWGGPVDDAIVDAVAARGVAWAAAGCAPSTLRDRLEAALIAADPAAADRRRELRKREAGGRVQGTGDGLADVRVAGMEAATAKLVKAQLAAFARERKADGDDRRAGEIETELVATLITRPWEAQDPAVAHVTINADLADLLPDAPAEADSATAEGTVPSDDAANDGAAEDEEAEEEAPEEEAADADADAEPATRDPRPSGDQARQDTPARGGSRVGHVGGLPVTPAAVRSLLQRIDALGLTHPDGGDLDLTITGERGRLLAVATPEELVAAAKGGRGLGPPPPAPGYTPTAAQYRYLRARDRHCRFPGCRQVARACDADHVIPYDHHDPERGGPTCVSNLAMLCRRHHRLKTHALGWRFAIDPDGTLHVTTPGGTTRTTRPPAMGEVLDLLDEPRPPYDPAADPPPF